MHSLAFLLKRSEELSSSLENIFITFSLYPDVVFSDKLKFLFYTLIPVAFAVYVPVSVIREFDLIKLIVVILFSVFISLLARFIFYKGLKNYSSSNLMSTK
jgi:ABC-2 type transport system permease protein